MANGLVFITSTSFTTQASVSIDNCFSASYTHYIVKRNLLGSTGLPHSVYLRFRVGGVDASAANYRQQQLSANSTTVAGSRTTGMDAWPNALGYMEATTFGYAELWISNPFEAVRTTGWVDCAYDMDADVGQYSYVMAHDLTTSYDGVTFYPASGTFTGSISVWGFAK